VAGQLQRTLGRNLQAIRLNRGFSQEEFAHVLGYHRTYMGSLERGERNLSLKKVEVLATRLHVEPLELLTEGSFGR
jgi:transcriptional regulator with XRE-family HTH domain